MNKTLHQEEIEKSIAKEVTPSKVDIQFSNDCVEANNWLLENLNNGMIPSALHNPLILSVLGDDDDYHTVKDVASAMVVLDREEYGQE